VTRIYFECVICGSEVVQGYSNKSTLFCTAVIRLLDDVSTLIRATKTVCVNDYFKY